VKRPRGLSATVVIAVIIAGCSHVPASTGSGDNPVSAHDASVTFAECMRSHGVNAFPDPDTSGSLTIDGVLNGSSLDPNSASWKQAMAACQDLAPPGFTGTTVTAAQLQARLTFAQCIRDHGVTDFPDPTADGPLIDTTRIPSTATAAGRNSLHAAMRACHSLLAATGVTAP
jgi:hypothetical protein